MQPMYFYICLGIFSNIHFVYGRTVQQWSKEAKGPLMYFDSNISANRNNRSMSQKILKVMFNEKDNLLTNTEVNKTIVTSRYESNEKNQKEVNLQRYKRRARGKNNTSKRINRRRTARYRQRFSNSTKNQRTSSRFTRTRVSFGSNLNNALHSPKLISLSTKVIEGMGASSKLRQATLEIFLRVEDRSGHGGASKRIMNRIKILPFLIRQENSDQIIEARGYPREIRRSKGPEFGANHSGRTRSKAWTQRFEFVITNLLQKVYGATENRTERNRDSSIPFTWTLPDIYLSVVCLRRRHTVPCSKYGIRMSESPRFVFHTRPFSNNST